MLLSLNKSTEKEFHVMHRKQLKAKTEKNYNEGQTELKLILQKGDTVATTGDLWTTHHRTFCGTTITWINEDTLPHVKDSKVRTIT